MPVENVNARLELEICGVVVAGESCTVSSRSSSSSTTFGNPENVGDEDGDDETSNRGCRKEEASVDAILGPVGRLRRISVLLLDGSYGESLTTTTSRGLRPALLNKEGVVRGTWSLGRFADLDDDEDAAARCIRSAREIFERDIGVGNRPSDELDKRPADDDPFDPADFEPPSEPLRESGVDFSNMVNDNHVVFY